MRGKSGTLRFRRPALAASERRTTGMARGFSGNSAPVARKAFHFGATFVTALIGLQYFFTSPVHG
jgi:hypothetical protein